ncbi:MAG: HAD-IIB family hydrolase [Candidatus Diapherotrites archaeon]|nr:HAD-IIB family hydrolase [Candidatus Diapherotrites archaeon]
MDLFVFDVDGVLTDEYARVDEDLVKAVDSLSLKHAVALVTGRSWQWLEKHVLPFISDGSSMHFFCENGNVLVKKSGGKYRARILDALPRLASAEVKRRVSGLKGVFFDDSKRTMVSVEAVHELAVKDPELVSGDLDAAGEILREVGERFSLEYVPTTYARDLVHPGVNKKSAMKCVLRALGWPTHAFVFGDSPADALMSEALLEESVPHEFFYVGEKPVSASAVRSHEKYAAGTKELLRRFI